MLTVVFVMSIGVIVALGASLLVVADMVADKDAQRRARISWIQGYPYYVQNCTARGVAAPLPREYLTRRPKVY